MKTVLLTSAILASQIPVSFYRAMPIVPRPIMTASPAALATVEPLPVPPKRRFALLAKYTPSFIGVLRDRLIKFPRVS